jgi:hypothetical protein
LRKIKIFPKVQPLPRRSATIKKYKLLLPHRCRTAAAPLPHRYRAAMDISGIE